MPKNKITGSQLSGNSYITMRLRGDSEITGLPVVHPSRCNHGAPSDYDEELATACMTAECLNSWSMDWQFYLHRTIKGRQIISRFHLTHEQITLLAERDFRPLELDVFAAKYDY